MKHISAPNVELLLAIFMFKSFSYINSSTMHNNDS